MSDIPGMTLPATDIPARPASSSRCPLGIYTPRTFTARARWRFRRDRIARLKADFGIVAPTVEQASLIAGIVAEGWAALVADHEGRYRDAAEHRRVERLLRQDLRRSLSAPPPARLTIAERIAAARQARERPPA